MITPYRNISRGCCGVSKRCVEDDQWTKLYEQLIVVQIARCYFQDRYNSTFLCTGVRKRTSAERTSSIQEYV